MKLKHMLVDNCAMQLVMNPGQFDVILTENMFGDILSDEASMITGSIGMLSSRKLRMRQSSVFMSQATVLHRILQAKTLQIRLQRFFRAAMMLRYSLDLDKEADAS